MEVRALAAVGRIVAASLQNFETECFQGEPGPALGTLIMTMDGDPPVYGAVSSIVTQGVDPSRPVAPHGNADEDLPTVLKRHPHLPILLRTTFQSTMLGYDSRGVVHQVLPDVPPPLVARVRACTLDEQCRFVERLDFLERLLTRSDIADEVVAAFLRRAGAAQQDTRGFLLAAARALVPLLGAEPERLAAVVHRIRPQW